MILATSDTPRYESDGWANAIEPPETLAESQAASKRFFAAQEQHRTQASRVQDLGRGIAALGASVFILAACCGVGGWSSMSRWRSPRRAWMIYIAAVGSWLLLAKANIWWLMYTGERGDYPPWADTLIIPIISIGLLTALGLPILAIVLIVSLWHVPLPAMVADLKPSVRFWLATIGAAVTAALLVEALVFDIRDGAAVLVAPEVVALGAVAAWWPAAAARRAV